MTDRDPALALPDDCDLDASDPHWPTAVCDGCGLRAWIQDAGTDQCWLCTATAASLPRVNRKPRTGGAA